MSTLHNSIPGPSPLQLKLSRSIKKYTLILMFFLKWIRIILSQFDHLFYALNLAVLNTFFFSFFLRLDICHLEKLTHSKNESQLIHKLQQVIYQAQSSRKSVTVTIFFCKKHYKAWHNFVFSKCFWMAWRYSGPPL